MLTRTLREIFRTNLAVRRQERLLVFTDLPTRHEVLTPEEQERRGRLMDIARLVEETGRGFAREVRFCAYPARRTHGVEPPEMLWRHAFGARAVAALAGTGVLRGLLAKRIDDAGLVRAETVVARHRRQAVECVIALSNFSTSHTRFRDLLTRVCGTRYASMPLFSVGMLEGAMAVDWKALARFSRTVARRINHAVGIELATSNGSRLSFSIRGRKAAADTGILTAPGAFGNLPAGEAYIAPVEGTAEGTLILEWSPAGHLSPPVVLSVGQGLVTDVQGDGPFAGALRKRLGQRRANRNIAEFGIGTNERASRPDNLLEAEKILGTVHVALGDNSTFGGLVRTPFHQDFVFFRPTVTLIGRARGRDLIMKDGHLLGREHR